MSPSTITAKKAPATRPPDLVPYVAAGAEILSVDYRLAPENPFLTPLEDCWTALAWIRSSAAKLGIDPARITLFGESAGPGPVLLAASRQADTDLPDGRRPDGYGPYRRARSLYSDRQGHELSVVSRGASQI